MDVTHPMRKATDLPANSLHHASVSVSGHGHSESTRQIDIAVSVRVPHVAPPRLLPEDGKVVGEVGDVARLDLGEALREATRPGTGRRNLDEGRLIPVGGLAHDPPRLAAGTGRVNEWRAWNEREQG